MSQLTVEEKIKSSLEKLRVFLQNDGGDVEFVKFQNGIVYVRMMGACQGCFALDTTLKDGIETILMEEYEEVLAVEQI